MNRTEHIEVEIKFLLANTEARRIQSAVEALQNIQSTGRVYEKTMMFDNEHCRMQKEDARLRVRQIGDCVDASKIEFAYKRRLPVDGRMKKEEEIEVAFETDPKQLVTILGKMGYVMTTSYERYRSTYLHNELNVKITFDEFPFGYILEIEGHEEDIKTLCTKLGLDIEASTLESCDDVYDRLCRERGIVVQNHIAFSDSTMPHLG
jgi:adenylate cyclase class IV